MYSVYKITGVIITKLRKQETAAVVWKRTLAMKSHQHHFTSDKMLVKKWADMKQKKKIWRHTWRIPTSGEEGTSPKMCIATVDIAIDNGLKLGLTQCRQT